MKWLRRLLYLLGGLVGAVIVIQRQSPRPGLSRLLHEPEVVSQPRAAVVYWLVRAAHTPEQIECACRDLQKQVGADRPVVVWHSTGKGAAETGAKVAEMLGCERQSMPWLLQGALFQDRHRCEAGKAIDQILGVDSPPQLVLVTHESNIWALTGIGGAIERGQVILQLWKFEDAHTAA